MERVGELSGGLIAVNPNTMYPLLRQLEQQGLVRGRMGAPRAPLAALLPPHRRPARPSAGRLAVELGPRLDAVAAGLDLIRRELRL